ncbi:C45 family autoproteolytic acyltransferase/hydolase [Roseivivax sp. CAU 1753]
MTTMTLTFDAVDEPTPGPKWAARWDRSWPAYEAWFIGRGGDRGPSARECRAALERHMPEIVALYDRLVALAGGSDRAARFLSTWCPPHYLGGCSIAAMADDRNVRLVRNYDLSPDLNEGLMLRTEWTGRKVMGMVEFLWGLSDGINDAGLSVALAYGGRSDTSEGFGITTILRYLLETCETVDDAVAALHRVPSHMAYNVVLADASGRTASVEVAPGGGAKVMARAVATNHQDGPSRADRPGFTRTHERHDHLSQLVTDPVMLNAQFLRRPLLQDRYSEGFGTLFTAEYDPKNRALGLTLCGSRWDQTIEAFEEGRRVVDYARGAVIGDAVGDAIWKDTGSDVHGGVAPDWSLAARIDWCKVASDYANNRGRPIETYLPRAA